ncbi:long-chain fatty acid--CoA ligase [Novipirellula artificiosorum]|uniref:Long-chain-fatty-acid--CoA ligase n=1 Tax=Novipirellula artificiosorum TaxID=2528016 RepID=A0A5C6DSW4_9BACT|nr:class I adenylate-forming enzyme family protein [Novipirellula artificiosorum]TWU39762.1 Long-chain-fatty-acid--CoA ligase [Novipirellula artificiosorum]
MNDWKSTLTEYRDRVCFAGGGNDETVTYGEMVEMMRRLEAKLRDAGVTSRSVVAFPGRYSPESVAMFVTLADMKAVAVPMPDDAKPRINRLMSIAHVTHAVDKNKNVAEVAETFDPRSETTETLGEFRYGGDDSDRHPLYDQLSAEKHAGLVLFTSGTTGDPKAAVQDLDRLRLRYSQPRQVGNMMAFMHIDHIGGVNTSMYVLSHGGTLVVPRARTPEAVAEAIEHYKIEVLPVSPTFLNLLLLSNVSESFELSSLRRITYGSEAMPPSVLARLREAFPNAELLQTYGTTELGILKSKSENNGSLWMKVGGEGYETKVVDGRLWVKAHTAMLGYLNAPSPFDAEGFMDTNDEVDVRGDWMKILGRKSDFINVGGTKVSPVEVESVLLEMPVVSEASVSGQAHPLMGQVVMARLTLSGSMKLGELKQRMREHCKDRLPAEAIPVKITIADGSMVTDRFKRAR